MDNSLFLARIGDTLTICERTGKPKFFGFLSIEETALAKNVIKNKNCDARFFGGYEGAQRVLLGCFPDWCDNADFPITAITFSYHKDYTLSHRDFLGSLMGLGLKREAVGDILVENGRAVAFVLDEIAPFIISSLEKVGRVGVTATKGYSSPLPEASKLAEFSVTVASGRIDGVVSALANISRGESCKRIEAGLVSVNSVVCEKISKTICEGDVVTVRSVGKFIVNSLSERSRKDRMILRYKKYV